MVFLSSVSNEAGYYSAVFEPVAENGTAIVKLRHFNAHTCDQIHTINLVLKDGKIQEIESGSSTISPSDEDLNPYISGSWVEKDTQFTILNIDSTKDGGWTVEISSPITHGAYIIRATIYYDCEMDAFVYTDGLLFDLNSAGQIPEKASEEGLMGTLVFHGSEEAPELIWHNNSSINAEIVQFERTVAETNHDRGISKEVITMFEKAMDGFVGENYEPVLDLGEKDNIRCILCSTTVIYPGAKPSHALVYFSEHGLQKIVDIWNDIHQ